MCLWGCLRETLPFGSVDWVKQYPSSLRQGITQSGECLNRTKEEEGPVLSLCLCLSWDLVSHNIASHGSWAFRLNWDLHCWPGVLRPSHSDWRTPLAILVFQLADVRLWDFSASMSAWANSYNKSLLRYICIYSVGSVSSDQRGLLRNTYRQSLSGIHCLHSSIVVYIVLWL